MNILVVGDSYGLPRLNSRTDEVALAYQETYPEILRCLCLDKFNEDIRLLNRCQHVNTTHTLITGEINQLWFLKPDFVIIQLGIVDLWPAKRRKIPPIQEELAGLDPWVNAKKYKENIEKFCECALELGSKIILVSVPRVSKGITFKYGDIEERIDNYNSVLEKLSDETEDIFYLDWKRIMGVFPEYKLIGEDGIHLKKEGSQILAEVISRVIAENRV